MIAILAILVALGLLTYPAVRGVGCLCWRRW